MSSTRVGLRPHADPRLGSVAGAPEASSVLPFLDPRGPVVVLGADPTPSVLAEPVVPSARTLFGPRGAAVASDGSLWVADTGHHRLLGWARLPADDRAPADFIVGQEALDRGEARNGGRPTAADTLDVPTGVTALGKGLAVADAWNHRVLIWFETPAASHVPADLVLGQDDFAGRAPNRGGEPSAASMHWPYGVHWDGERLFVADAQNRRVLIWNGTPQAHGQPADLVLGHPAFDRRDENDGHAPDASSMRWPHSIVRFGTRLLVADAGNNRVMVWDDAPQESGVPCDRLLGQAEAAAVDHNRGSYLPTACSMNMPYAVTALGERVVVADTANSRLTVWDESALAGGSASGLAGQHHFGAKGDNRWGLPVRDSLCWPYDVTGSGADLVVVADTGNHRVLLWRSA